MGEIKQNYYETNFHKFPWGTRKNVISEMGLASLLSTPQKQPSCQSSKISSMITVIHPGFFYSTLKSQKSAVEGTRE